MTTRSILLVACLTLAPASVLAQGLPAADEIALPGARAPRSAPAERRDPPSASRAPSRPPRAATRRARSSRARRPRRAARQSRRDDDDLTAAPSSDEPSDLDEDAEAARLEEEGIEYEVRQEMEWEDRRRRERESARPPPRDHAEDREIPPAPPPRQARDDEEMDRPRRRARPEPEDDAAAESPTADAELEGEAEAHPRRGATPEPDLLRLAVGMSATTRQQVIDRADGSTIRFGLTPFASAYGSLVVTPFARLHSGPTGLGAAVSYDRAIRMEAVSGEQVLDASADHLAALLLYRIELPGRVRIEPHVGYDLARFLLAPNDTLPGIVYESISLGGNVQIPVLRDARTGTDKLRVRLGGAMYFPIGLGEAAAVWGQSGSASGFSFEGGVEGTVSGMFGYFALLRHASYSATFHTATVASGGETESTDGVTTGLCGGSVRF